MVWVYKNLQSAAQPYHPYRPLSSPLKAQQELGVGLGWLYGAASAPPMFML